MTSIDPGTAVAPTRVLHRQTVLHLAVAHAVRRDLARLTRVLGDPVTAVRRDALAAHVTFLLDQLADQHRVLDCAVWPLAAARQPALADLLERVELAHSRLVRPVVRARSAALRWRSAPDARAAVLDAVRDLDVALAPVLAQDAELLPLACAALPATVTVSGEPSRPGRPTRLARRMFWLLDDLDLPTAELFLQRTPRIVMWVLRNGFSGGYNRAAYLMWVGGGTGPAV